MGFLALEGLLKDGCARHCPSHPLESPGLSSGDCRSGPEIGKGVDFHLGKGVLRRTAEKSVLEKARSQFCCMAEVQKYEAVEFLQSTIWGLILGLGGGVLTFFFLLLCPQCF